MSRVRNLPSSIVDEDEDEEDGGRLLTDLIVAWVWGSLLRSESHVREKEAIVEGRYGDELNEGDERR